MAWQLTWDFVWATYLTWRLTRSIIRSSNWLDKWIEKFSEGDNCFDQWLDQFVGSIFTLTIALTKLSTVPMPTIYWQKKLSWKPSPYRGSWGVRLYHRTQSKVYQRILIFSGPIIYGIFQRLQSNKKKKKSRRRETLNLSTDANNSTNTKTSQ